MAAVLVGTAITALSGSDASASQPAPQAVQSISKYCQVCWRNARLSPDSWPDCTQEVLVRLLQSVQPERWDDLLKQEGDERREFLRAIDAVKKRTQRAHRYSAYVEETPDRTHEPMTARNELREEINLASGSVLSSRQQRIVQLTCEGWTIPEIADELRTSAERVSDEKYKAIRKLRKELNG